MPHGTEIAGWPVRSKIRVIRVHSRDLFRLLDRPRARRHGRHRENVDALKVAISPSGARFEEKLH